MNRNSRGEIVIKGWTLKELGSSFLFFAIVFLIVGNYFYQNHLESVQKQQTIDLYRQKVEKYENRLENCIDGRKLFPYFYESNPRSNQRLEEITLKFVEVVKAPCLILQDNKAFTNPYHSIDMTKLRNVNSSGIEEEFYQALLYEFDKGIPFLRTGGSICADGSYSASVGRGTCSWHGGYAAHRGEMFKFEYAEMLYDPRIRLNILLTN